MKLLARLLLFLLFGCFTVTVCACPRSNCVRIGTWNLEWLGSSLRGMPADKNTTDQMVDLITHQLSIDLIVLEEVNTDMDGESHGEHFSVQPWHDLKAALERQGYHLQHGASGYAQHVVFAWRSPIIALENAHELDVPDHFELDQFCRSSRLRKPLTSRFHAGDMEFWFVGVHLKAQGANHECATAIEKEQVELMAQQLSALHTKNPNILIAGDFNMTEHKAALHPLESDFETLDNKQRRNPASAHSSYLGHSDNPDNTGHEHRGSVIDHLLSTPSLLKQWLPLSTTIYQPANTQAYKEIFSDHVPIWADFSLTTR